MSLPVEAKSTPDRRGVIQGIVIAAILLFLGFLAYLIFLRGAGQLASGPAPDFTLKTFDGQTITLAAQKGKVVVINIWASWCKPSCWDEAPILERVWQKYQDKGVLFIGVDYNDTEPKAKEFIQTFKITYPNGPDLGGRIYQAYRAKGVPETYFVGKDGKLAGNYIGPITTGAGPFSEANFIAKIESLLAQP